MQPVSINPRDFVKNLFAHTENIGPTAKQICKDLNNATHAERLEFCEIIIAELGNRGIGECQILIEETAVKTFICEDGRMKGVYKQLHKLFKCIEETYANEKKLDPNFENLAPLDRISWIDSAVFDCFIRRNPKMTEEQANQLFNDLIQGPLPFKISDNEESLEIDDEIRAILSEFDDLDLDNKIEWQTEPGMITSTNSLALTTSKNNIEESLEISPLETDPFKIEGMILEICKHLTEEEKRTFARTCTLIFKTIMKPKWEKQLSEMHIDYDSNWWNSETSENLKETVIQRNQEIYKILRGSEWIEKYLENTLDISEKMFITILECLPLYLSNCTGGLNYALLFKFFTLGLKKSYISFDTPNQTKNALSNFALSIYFINQLEQNQNCEFAKASALGFSIFLLAIQLLDCDRIIISKMRRSIEFRQKIGNVYLKLSEWKNNLVKK